MKYGYIWMRLFAPLINLIVFLVNIVIRRDKKILLFGAWMGDKYTDNSRFMYEYLKENIADYDIKKVIWVTRNQDVYNLLKNRGSEVYMMHSLESLYYHLKAGVHVICNMEFSKRNYAGDIMGHLSGNAIKINTWHGIPIKAGKSTGINNINKGFISNIKYHLRNDKMFCSIFTPGHWEKEYMFSTGAECTRRLSEFCGLAEKQFIECGYPRNLGVVDIKENEEQIIKKIQQYNSVILYLPTFRENGSVPHPLDNAKLRNFLYENNFLWIEKPHPSEKGHAAANENSKNIVLLMSDFDINVIMPEISLLISDYSSAIYDSVAFSNPVLYFAPDYEYYRDKDRGFLCNYEELAGDLMANTIEDLISLLNEYRNGDLHNKLASNVEMIKQTILENSSSSYEDMLKEIYTKLDIIKRIEE